MFRRKSAGSWHREPHVFNPPNPLTLKYSSITVSQLLPGIPVELTNYGDSYNIAPIFGMFATNINDTTHTPHDEPGINSICD